MKELLLSAHSNDAMHPKLSWMHTGTVIQLYPPVEIFFFYHPQVGVGVWAELLIFICTTESLLTCSRHVAFPGGKKSNQRGTRRTSCSRVSFGTNRLKYATGSNEERAFWSLIYSKERQPKSQNADKRIWLTGFASRFFFVFFPLIQPVICIQWKKCITPTEPNVLSWTWAKLKGKKFFGLKKKNETTWLILSRLLLILKLVNREPVKI